MNVVDTHCHIHDPEFASKYNASVGDSIAEAAALGVTKYICVGTSAQSSKHAVEFLDNNSGAYAALALHPHEIADKGVDACNKDFLTLEPLLKTGNKRIVAIGECGLDYYYHSDKTIQKQQQELFKKHLDMGLKYDLPFIFHIREAFDDFFEILDDYKNAGKQIRGVVHSFSAHEPRLNGCLSRGLYIGLNGIMTFTKDQLQLDAAIAAPLDKIVLETDAPFLTPKPFRGKMCELKHVVVTAEFLSSLRAEDIQTFTDTTTANAHLLFSL